MLKDKDAPSRRPVDSQTRATRAWIGRLQSMEQHLPGTSSHLHRLIVAR